MSSKRITWSKDGNWGIEGVDLTALPPKVYGALYKLHNMEGLIEVIQDPESKDFEVELATEELLGADTAQQK